MKYLSFTYSFWGTVHQFSSPYVHVNFTLAFLTSFESNDACCPKVQTYLRPTTGMVSIAC